jgi:small subunit ribosomal protein S16
MGTKQRPFYRVVVSDGRLTPGGPFVDVLGTYDPSRAPAAVKIDVARADEWLGKGAHPSDTVRSLLLKARAAARG